MPSELRPKKWVRITVSLAIFMFALTIFFKNQILLTVGTFITCESSTDIVDGNLAMLLMGDSTGERAQAALDFSVKYPQSAIVIAPEQQNTFVARAYYLPSYQTHKKFLIDGGVSEASIVIPDCLNASTFDEAVCLRRYITKEFPDVDSIVVITSWYHSKRAKWIFEKVFNDTGIKIKSLTAQSELSSPAEWWTREQSFLQVFNEYIKWLYWLTRSSSLEYPGPG